MLLLVGAMIAFSASAHEGMWLLNKIKQVNEAEMRELGFELTAEDIYNINGSSMKDAVVRLGRGFCTAEVVSSQGLLFTNHHCAYSAIQSHSTVEHDYLTDGFWAMSKDQELPIEGVTASMLVRIDDVTEQVNAALSGDMSEEERAAKIDELSETLIAESIGDDEYEALFKTMFEGNQFFIFLYKTYYDVRLVGAPPSSIGKFGGDTDNWMWPRHTGDFSMLRIYADKENNPSPYSEENVPFEPAWHFPVSMSGVQQGDFAMVMGFPGSTDRYLSSQGVKLALDVEQPARVKIRGKKLELMKEDMDKSDATRIKYATKYAQVSNYWKYFIGQQKGLKRLKVYDKKKQIEDDLMAWVKQDPAREKEYGDMVKMLDEGYEQLAQVELASVYLQEAAFGSEATVFGFGLIRLQRLLESEDPDPAAIKEMTDGIAARADDHFKDYNAPTDRKITAAMFEMIHSDVPRDQQPDIMGFVEKKFKSNFDAWAEYVFEKSILTDRGRLDAFLAKPNKKVLAKDPGMAITNSCLKAYRGPVAATAQSAQGTIDHGYRLLVKAMMEKDPQKQWYPNANSSIRMTYGQVGDYIPADAMHYDFITTSDGIVQKEDPTNDEFIVPEHLMDLIENKDFGPYGVNGKLPICFISNNDITGGNSGSPVINGRGELIGIAFDGNWEAMSGDIAFEPELQRTISVDIRYVLFIIDKYAGAKHLIEEMDLVYAKKEVTEKAEEAMETSETEDSKEMPERKN